jgi:hypothetical protein
MKTLIQSIINRNKKVLHSINPHEADVTWNGRSDLTGTPNYHFSETWEMMEVGYDHETDLTLRILLADWPGIPEQGDVMTLLGDSWKVAARDRTSDGSEAVLLLQRGE